MTWWHYGMMTFCIVGKTCQSVVILVPISCGPCANQLRSLRYRLMESSLRPALTTTTRDKQPSASMLSNHRQGLHFCGQTLLRDRVATVVESSGVKETALRFDDYDLLTIMNLYGSKLFFTFATSLPIVLWMATSDATNKFYCLLPMSKGMFYKLTY